MTEDPLNRLWIALVAGALLLSASAASADSVTNTFTGVVAADSGTDLGNYFGGGSLVGDPFTLTMTLDSTLVTDPTFATGGTFYYGPSPITAALTINGITQTIGDSSDAFLADLGSGTIEAYEQAFNLINQVQSPGVSVDLSTNVPATLDLRAPLPAMLLASGDFINNGATFYDSSENIDLTVQTVNVPMPEPGSLILLAVGLVALALLLPRHAT